MSRRRLVRSGPVTQRAAWYPWPEELESRLAARDTMGGLAWGTAGQGPTPRDFSDLGSSAGVWMADPGAAAAARALGPAGPPLPASLHASIRPAAVEDVRSTPP